MSHDAASLAPLAAIIRRALSVTLLGAVLLALPVLVTECEASGSPPRGERRNAEPASPPAEATQAGPLRIDVNTASAAELEQVKGIGPRTAQRIIEARETGGRFRDAEDLRKRVTGIGPAKVKSMSAGGLNIPVAQGSVSPGDSARPRPEMIVGQPPGKREARRGSLTSLPPPGSPR
jgi:competence ComEA-like helix-hairpin-helix protein